MEEKQKLEGEMETLQQRIIMEGRTEESSKEEGIIIGKLEERRKQEEVLWRQKSRIKWLREGERNTKFFHQAMIQHRQRNRILSMKNENGERIVEQEGIEKVLMEYHKEILIESQVDRSEAIEEVCKAIPRIVIDNQNRALMRAANLEEVEDVVMNMNKGYDTRTRWLYDCILSSRMAFFGERDFGADRRIPNESKGMASHQFYFLHFDSKE